jgi:hypothetical protein
MSKVNVSLQGVFTAPANVPVTVKSVLVASQNVVVGTVGALPEQQTKRTDLSGRVPSGFDLLTGRYLISAQSPTVVGVGYAVLIDAPNDNAVYEHTQLIVPVIGGAAPFSQPISTNQNASDVTFGLVKLLRNGANPLAVTGVYHVADVAALKAVKSDASNIYATLFKRQAQEPKEFYWDGLRSDADDAVGFTIVRPSDFVAMGSLGVWVQVAN